MQFGSGHIALILVSAIFAMASLRRVNAAPSLWDIETLLEKYHPSSLGCILKYCEKYFRSTKAMIGSLVIVTITPTESTYQNRILKALNGDGQNDWAVMVKDGRKLHRSAKHVTEKAKNYFLMIAESIELEDNVKLLQRLPTWNPLAHVIVLFTKKLEEPFRTQEVHTVLEYFFEKSVLNVNVMVTQKLEPIVDVFTWFPYEADDCADNINSVQLLDTCEFDAEPVIYVNGTPSEHRILKQITYSHNYGPKVPVKFHGCPLRIASAVWEPYAVYDEQYGFKRGIEVLMMRTISSHIDMVPEFQLLNRSRASSRSEEYYMDLLLRKTDVMIGGLNENAMTRKLLSSSIPYFQDDLTWCVQTAPLAGNFMNVFNIFDLATWGTSIVILQTTAMLFYWLLLLENVVKKFNYVWAVITILTTSLGSSVQYFPQRIFTRLFFISFLFYGINFNTAYHSFLITALTRPRHLPQINNLDEAIAEQFTFAGSATTIAYYNKDDEISNYVHRNYHICTIIDNCLQNIRQHDKLGVAVSREHAKNSRFISETEMYCFKRANNIYSYSVSMLVHKDYHLLPIINDNIRRILESGLLNKWEKESRISRITTSGDAEAVHSGSGATVDGNTVLRLDHISGAFFVVFVGTVYSLTVFAAEHLVLYFRKRNMYKLFCDFNEKWFLENNPSPYTNLF